MLVLVVFFRVIIRLLAVKEQVRLERWIVSLCVLFQMASLIVNVWWFDDIFLKAVSCVQVFQYVLRLSTAKPLQLSYEYLYLYVCMHILLEATTTQKKNTTNLFSASKENRKNWSFFFFRLVLIRATDLFSVRQFTTETPSTNCGISTCCT